MKLHGSRSPGARKGVHPAAHPNRYVGNPIHLYDTKDFALWAECFATLGDVSRLGPWDHYFCDRIAWNCDVVDKITSGGRPRTVGHTVECEPGPPGRGQFRVHTSANRELVFSI